MVYTPLAPTQPKIELQTMQSIMALDWDQSLDIVLGREDMDKRPAEGDGFQNITAKYNWARALALAGNYDALLTIEADMVVPPMTLHRLTNTDASVSYGLYCSRRAKKRWLLFDEVTEHPFKAEYAGETRNERMDMWGQVVESKGMGMGCTLINRAVLEKVMFRCPNPTVCCDWYFSVDCQRLGFSQAHDCGVVCGHIDNGNIYWPEPEVGYWVEGRGV